MPIHRSASRRGRPLGKRLSLLRRLERMAAGQQSSLRLDRADVLAVLPLVQLSGSLSNFINAVRLCASNRLPRQSLDFMVDELILRFSEAGPRDVGGE